MTNTSKGVTDMNIFIYEMMSFLATLFSPRH